MKTVFIIGHGELTGKMIAEKVAEMGLSKNEEIEIVYTDRDKVNLEQIKEMNVPFQAPPIELIPNNIDWQPAPKFSKERPLRMGEFKNNKRRY